MMNREANHLSLEMLSESDRVFCYCRILGFSFRRMRHCWYLLVFVRSCHRVTTLLFFPCWDWRLSVLLEQRQRSCSLLILLVSLVKHHYLRIPRRDCYWSSLLLHASLESPSWTSCSLPLAAGLPNSWRCLDSSCPFIAELCRLVFGTIETPPPAEIRACCLDGAERWGFGAELRDSAYLFLPLARRGHSALCVDGVLGACVSGQAWSCQELTGPVLSRIWHLCSYFHWSRRTSMMSLQPCRLGSAGPCISFPSYKIAEDFRGHFHNWRSSAWF